MVRLCSDCIMNQFFTKDSDLLVSGQSSNVLFEQS